jgi:hypothetical protein
VVLDIYCSRASSEADVGVSLSSLYESKGTACNDERKRNHPSERERRMQLFLRPSARRTKIVRAASRIIGNWAGCELALIFHPLRAILGLWTLYGANEGIES